MVMSAKIVGAIIGLLLQAWFIMLALGTVHDEYGYGEPIGFQATLRIVVGLSALAVTVNPSAFKETLQEATS